MKLKGTKKNKKSKVEKVAPENVLVCEATGKKIKLGKIDDKAILRGEQRVFSSHEIAAEHTKKERIRGVSLVHRNAVYCDPDRNVRRFSTKASEFLGLMDSIKEEGILQPLVVQRSLDHKPAMYVLRAGFRRMEAAKRLELDLIPITIADEGMSAKVIGLLENLGEDMKPIEMATAIKAIMDEGKTNDKGKKVKLSQRQISKMLGMSQSKVSDLLGIVGDLHPKVSRAVTDGTIPLSKAALLKQLPTGAQEKAMKMAADLDVKNLRKYVQDTRGELGVEAPRHGAKPDKPRSVKGRKFKVRKVGELVDACMAAEELYFKTKGGKTSTNRLKCSTLQYAMSILESPDDKPAHPKELARVAEEAEKARLERPAEGRKKAQENRAAKKRGAKGKKDDKGNAKKGKKFSLVKLPKVKK